MSNKPKASVESQEQALIIANGIKKSGQTKEQTKLVAAGIEKGIAQYKKQHKAKMREQDKQRKKQVKASAERSTETPSLELSESNKHTALPWVLLALSWALFIGYALLWAK